MVILGLLLHSTPGLHKQTIISNIFYLINVKMCKSYAILETNHTPKLISLLVLSKTKNKRIITPLSQVTRLHWACATSL